MGVNRMAKPCNRKLLKEFHERHLDGSSILSLRAPESR